MRARPASEQLGADQQGEDAAQQERGQDRDQVHHAMRLWSSVSSQDRIPRVWVR